jgi:hypothetical protein
VFVNEAKPLESRLYPYSAESMLSKGPSLFSYIRHLHTE